MSTALKTEVFTSTEVKLEVLSVRSRDSRASQLEDWTGNSQQWAQVLSLIKSIWKQSIWSTRNYPCSWVALNISLCSQTSYIHIMFEVSTPGLVTQMGDITIWMPFPAKESVRMMIIKTHVLGSARETQNLLNYLPKFFGIINANGEQHRWHLHNIYCCHFERKTSPRLT